MDVIDWDLAANVATRLAPSGPKVTEAEARAAVVGLRDSARAAVAPVAACTGLAAPPESPEALVVDRPAWIRSNMSAFQQTLEPVLERLRAEAASSRAVTEVGSRVTAVQLGGVLAWMSGKVLGQYEALVPVGAEPRLLLVAPNIVHVAAELELDAHDFQLWVCLHEQTHRVQFTAVPWLAHYFKGEVRAFVVASDVPAADYLRRAGAILQALVRAIRSGDGATAVARAAMSPGQREIFDRLVALMTLVEGHADFVMDAVGPEVVPTVAVIRQAFERRRANPGAVDGAARRLLGFDAKMRQYSEGAAFVRAVIAAVGMDGFNEVWAGPERLPTMAEIAEPQAWLRRVQA